VSTVPARPVELRVQDVVHHASSVSNFEAAGLNSTHSGRANNRNALLFSCQDELPSHVLGNSLSNDGNGFNLK
jgi:hypothetical protein